MNEVLTRQVPKSLGGIAAGFMAAQLLTVPARDDPHFWRDWGSNILRFQSSPTLPTFSFQSNSTTGEIRIAVEQVEPSLVAFFSNLLAQQQRLGIEFEKVLYDNLWDLYAR